jgi:hypothetical protein
MGTKIRLFTTLVVGLIAAVALGASPPTTISALHHVPPSQVTIVGESDFGATIKVNVGTLIDIVLQDPWQPPNGWGSPEIHGKAVVSPDPDPVRGADGTDTFRLRAVKKGHATVSLICEPPPGLMMPMLPVRLFQVTFNVKP